MRPQWKTEIEKQKEKGTCFRRKWRSCKHTESSTLFHMSWQLQHLKILRHCANIIVIQTKRFRSRSGRWHRCSELPYPPHCETPRDPGCWTPRPTQGPVPHSRSGHPYAAVRCYVGVPSPGPAARVLRKEDPVGQVTLRESRHTAAVP